MEIDKILFGRLAETKGVENSFEDLDVNGDNVIDEKDAQAAADNQAITSQITNILNYADEEAELSLDVDFDINNLSKAGAATKSGASDSATADDSAAGVSKEEYQKSITKFTYSGLGSDGNLRKEMESKQGVSFVLMNLVGVSTEHCGSGVSSFVNVTNDKNCILDTMYDLKDYANFKYVQTKAIPSPGLGEPAKNKPCIVKYVDGKVAETIWLEPEQANAEGIKNIFMSQLGLTNSDVDNNSAANNTASVSDNTAANSNSAVEEGSDVSEEASVSDITTTNAGKTSTSSVAASLTQFEIDKLNDEQEEIQNNIESKQKEIETKQKKIEAKQEELEALVKNAQNNNDNSQAAYIAELQTDIQVLAAEIETLQSDIEQLQSDYRTNSIMLTALNANLDSTTASVNLEPAESTEVEKAGYKDGQVADPGAEEVPTVAMIDSAGNGSMIDNSPNAIKKRKSVENLSHKTFKKLSEKDIEKIKNKPSTIKNPDGTYTAASTHIAGYGCITFDEEGNILYNTITYESYRYGNYADGNYAAADTYDGSGRLLARTCFNGKTVTYEYNDDGTYTKTVMMGAKTTTYRYKNDGELISKESQNSVDEEKQKKAHVHTHSDGSYTILNVGNDYSPSRHIGFNSVSGKVDKMTQYDCNGKPISQTEVTSRSGIKKCEEFDDEGRPLRYTCSNGLIYEYKYDDENGKVTGTLTRKDGYAIRNDTHTSIRSFLKSHGL